MSKISRVQVVSWCDSVLRGCLVNLSKVPTVFFLGEVRNHARRFSRALADNTLLVSAEQCQYFTIELEAVGKVADIKHLLTIEMQERISNFDETYEMAYFPFLNDGEPTGMYLVVTIEKDKLDKLVEQTLEKGIAIDNVSLPWLGYGAAATVPTEVAIFDFTSRLPVCLLFKGDKLQQVVLLAAKDTAPLTERQIIALKSKLHRLFGLSRGGDGIAKIFWVGNKVGDLANLICGWLQDWQVESNKFDNQFFAQFMNDVPVNISDSEQVVLAYALQSTISPPQRSSLFYVAANSLQKKLSLTTFMCWLFAFGALVSGAYVLMTMGTLGENGNVKIEKLQESIKRKELELSKESGVTLSDRQVTAASAKSKEKLSAVIDVLKIEKLPGVWLYRLTADKNNFALEIGALKNAQAQETLRRIAETGGVYDLSISPAKKKTDTTKYGVGLSESKKNMSEVMRLRDSISKVKQDERLLKGGAARNLEAHRKKLELRLAEWEKKLPQFQAPKVKKGEITPVHYYRITGKLKGVGRGL